MKLSLIYNKDTESMLAEDISTHQINFQAKEKPMKDGKSFLNLGTNAVNELELKVDVGNKDDVEELSTILVELLSYPNSEMADIHADAMRLGNYDLEKQSQNRNDTTTSLLDEKGASKVCPCCGFIKQTDTINLGTSFEDIKNMGVSTYLYFSNYKKLSILLVILTIIYSAYALITNVLASRNGSLSNIQSSVDYISISLSSKETNDNSTNRMYYFVQCWLGVATIVVWIFVLAYLKFNEIKSILDYDNDTISCSDYSVVMEGIPLDVTLEDLQKQLDVFYNVLDQEKKIPQKWKKPLKIAKINKGKPFYLNEESFKDQEINNLTKEIQETKQALINLVIQRRSSSTFSTPKDQRAALYEKYRDLLKKKADKLLKMVDNIKQSLKEGSNDQLTTIFVTFQSNIPKTFLSYLHQPSVLGRIQSICGKTITKFWYQRDGKNYQLEIRRAPEPQDIIWTNLGQNNCNTYLRKLFTFTVTMILLGICFAIVYGLSRAQEDAGGSRTISIAISLTISIVNIMLGQVIRRLTVFERDYTETYRQGSLAVKSVIAQMINTILIPIITAFYVKNKNLYYENGLVDNIFMLSISTIIVPPIVLFVNPYRILTAILRCYYSRPTKKLYQNQKEHNILQEGVEFQVGYQSIYPVSVFMFVCFFVSLQPIISVVAMLGYFLMYWVQKYSLFNRYRRPVPGTEFVNNAMYKMVCLGPIVYSFGSLTWANFSPNGIPPEAIVPNLIALGLSIILFIIPFNSIIVGLCMSESAQKPTLFDDDRIFMPSQYDRLNPDTQTEGCEDYKKYMEKKREQMKNMNQEQKDIFAKKMMLNVQRGQMFNQARPQQAMNYNYFQPQPQQQMMGYDFARTMAPNSMPFMGYSPYNPMGSNLYPPAYGFPQQPMAPQMQQAPPVMSVPQNVRPPQYQNSGFGPNYQPQANPINTLVSHANNPNQVGSMPGGFNNNPFANNQIFPPAASHTNLQPQPPQQPFGGYPNIPNYNPNNPYPGNQPQGRRW